MPFYILSLTLKNKKQRNLSKWYIFLDLFLLKNTPKNRFHTIPALVGRPTKESYWSHKNVFMWKKKKPWKKKNHMIKKRYVKKMGHIKIMLMPSFAIIFNKAL